MGGGLSMVLFSPKAWLREQLAPYLTAIKKSVAAAATGWPLLSEDPASPAVGAPWLLLSRLADAVPPGARIAGFNHSTAAPLDQQDLIELSVKTTAGQIVRFVPTSVES